MDDNKGLSYFLLGLGIGVAVGIVFAPLSGEETRARVRSKALEGGDYLRKRSEDLRESAGELVDRGKTAVSRQREQLNAAVEAGRQAYRETISEATGSQGVPNPEGV
jgi:gas vesicle protein